MNTVELTTVRSGCGAKCRGPNDGRKVKTARPVSDPFVGGLVELARYSGCNCEVPHQYEEGNDREHILGGNVVRKVVHLRNRGVPAGGQHQPDKAADTQAYSDRDTHAEQDEHPDKTAKTNESRVNRQHARP